MRPACFLLLLIPILLCGCLSFDEEQPDTVTGWTAWKSTSDGGLSDIVWTGKTFVAVGSSYPPLKPSRAAVYTSPDGKTWTLRDADTSASRLSAVAWTGKRLVAVGFPSVILSSPDGITWTPVAHPEIPGYAYFNDIVWTGSQLVVITDEGETLTSPDGLAWTAHTPNPNETFGLRSVAWTGRQLIAVGYKMSGQPYIATSVDGITWTPRPAPPGGRVPNLDCVVWNGDRAVAIGSYWDYSEDARFYFSSILTSSEGNTWDTVGFSTDVPLTGLATMGSQFVLFRGMGTFATSPDGVNWTPATFGATSYNLSSAVWQDGNLIAVGISSTRSTLYPAILTWRP